MTDDPKPSPARNGEGDDKFASPTELAGSADGALKAEFAARDALTAQDPDDVDDAKSLPLDGE